MMEPRQVAQDALSYEFLIDNYVLRDHPLWAIDRFVDPLNVRALPAPFYSDGGRPPIDPELMIRMLLPDYCLGYDPNVACEEVHPNLT